MYEKTETWTLVHEHIVLLLLFWCQTLKHTHSFVILCHYETDTKMTSHLSEQTYCRSSFLFFLFSFTAVAFTTTLTGETRAGLRSPRTTVFQWAVVSPVSVTVLGLSLDHLISTKRYQQAASVEPQSRRSPVLYCQSWCGTSDSFASCHRAVKLSSWRS